MNDVLRRKWHDLLRAWAVDPLLADRTFEEVRERYAGSGRYYHTLDHVQSVLETVESLGSYARNLNTVKMATWLHDVVYDSRASDNEERSADFAEQLCEKLSIPEGRVVASLILKTKTHDAGDDDTDSQVLIEADLAILGARDSAYRAYAEKIRQEYAWVPEPDYRMGRRQVLERFLTRPRIFHLLAHLKEPARRNIAAEIARLGAGRRLQDHSDSRGRLRQRGPQVSRHGPPQQYGRHRRHAELHVRQQRQRRPHLQLHVQRARLQDAHGHGHDQQCHPRQHPGGRAGEERRRRRRRWHRRGRRSLTCRSWSGGGPSERRGARC
jgi:predicted metal-dependent HD superfamily phosphohydrolase